MCQIVCIPAPKDSWNFFDNNTLPSEETLLFSEFFFDEDPIDHLNDTAEGPAVKPDIVRLVESITPLNRVATVIKFYPM